MIFKSTVLVMERARSSLHDGEGETEGSRCNP